MATKAPEWISYATCGVVGTIFVRMHLLEPWVAKIPSFNDATFLNVFATAFTLVLAENKFFHKLNFGAGMGKILAYSFIIYIGANIYSQYH